MECPLEGAHPVFEEHDEELLLDLGGGVMKVRRSGKG